MAKKARKQTKQKGENKHTQGHPNTGAMRRCTLTFFRPTPDGSCQVVKQAGKATNSAKYAMATS
jgi:hypothetical protein